MGVHTGTPRVAEGGYVGVPVHRAARIAALGHGRQVLVSASTAPLADGAHTASRSIGEHRLKDLSAPERIYQLGADEFPQLKSLDQTNLPVPSTPFLGRERERGRLRLRPRCERRGGLRARAPREGRAEAALNHALGRTHGSHGRGCARDQWRRKPNETTVHVVRQSGQACDRASPDSRVT